MSNEQRPYGGYWTQVKLNCVRQYLSAFIDNLETNTFITTYIDAFAGSGTVTMPKRKNTRRGFGLLPDYNIQQCVEGSPIQSLKLDKLFGEYYFVEKSQECFTKLHNVINSKFVSVKNIISVECMDANVFLMDYCWRTKWANRRAVIFLDPFGIGVNWETLQTIAETQAVDILYMFPLGIAVTRLLKCKGNICGKTWSTLTRLFGNDDWYSAIYTTIRRRGFLYTDIITKRQNGCEVIIEYFINRLKTIFPYVAINPLRLINSRELPIYLLCFASPSLERMEIAQSIFQRRCPKGAPQLSLKYRSI